MKILFVLYNNFECNSAIHVHNFANAMVELGHECIVAVPDKKESVRELSGNGSLYSPAEYEDIIKGKVAFKNNVKPDIIHIWTPREIPRMFFLQLKKKYNKSRYIVHLEDNEEIILSKQINMKREQLKKLSAKELTAIIPETCAHPVFYKQFLRDADGVTVIIDTLLSFVPKEMFSMVLWPIIDTERFAPREKNMELMRRLGMDGRHLIVCYTGNVHLANAHEVRSLYLAVALANREGLPVKLIRTGKDHCDFLGEQTKWAYKNSIELGRVNFEEIPQLLALADILIQPGKPDIFNDYRLPSKIPEFLSMGKPVVVPNTNIGRYLTDKENALITEKGDGLELLSIITNIAKNGHLRDKLSKGSREFALKNFNKKSISMKLERFYRKLLTKGSH